MKLDDFEDKRVVVWGAGREGRALVDAIARFGIGCTVTIVDDSPDGPSHIGTTPIVRDDTRHDVLGSADVIVRSPSISLYRPEVTALRARGIAMTSATQLWFASEPDNVIAVTGTKGKSTTASLISALLKATDHDVELVGNIGRAPIDALGVSDPQWWIVELSSYQTSALDVSPDIGVLTSLSPEHLDWHNGEQQYFDDKLNLFAHRGDATVVVNWSDAGVRAHFEQIPGRIMKATDVGFVNVDSGWFVHDDSRIVRVDDLRLLGRHNVALACTALQTIAAAGVVLASNRDAISSAMQTFAPLPHRLEVVTTRNGVTYVDDSIATTPAATIAALSAFESRHVTVLVGGYDRGLAYDELAEYVSRHADDVEVITFAQSGERIADAMKEKSVDALHAVSIDEAVVLATEMSKPGGVVLLSPGAPSFGLFRDYIERAAVFRNAIENL